MKKKGEILTQQLGLRVTPELLKMIHIKTAEATIKSGKRISINDYCLQVLCKAVGLDAPMQKKK